MTLSARDLLLVTGGTGLVGSHVIELARAQGLRVRSLVRSVSDTSLLEAWGIECVHGDMTDAASLRTALVGVTHVVHCAALVGDWGPAQRYQQVNVDGLRSFVEQAKEAESLQRFVHISSLGVYPARDHYGTDEEEPVNREGIDGYTLSKVEAEEVIRRSVTDERFPAVILRPGFIYGPRDRIVLPRLIERLRGGRFAYLGDGEQLLNNTYVGNLAGAVFLALRCDGIEGETFNITDGRLVTRREFIDAIATLADLPKPKRQIPLGVAKALAAVLEWGWRMAGRDEAPLLSKARIKFLGLNLDFAIDKARRSLGYDPQIDFVEGMQTTMAWFREEGSL